MGENAPLTNNQLTNAFHRNRVALPNTFVPELHHPGNAHILAVDHGLAEVETAGNHVGIRAGEVLRQFIDAMHACKRIGKCHVFAVHAGQLRHVAGAEVIEELCEAPKSFLDG